jgi:hypothetical protein
MDINFYTVTYLSIIVWLFPPFRQYKTSVFYYFLVLGIADIFSLFFLVYLRIQFLPVYVIFSYCLLVALLEFEYIKSKKIAIVSLGIIIACLCLVKIVGNFYISLIAFFHLMIIFRILYLFVMKVAQKQVIDFFYLVLAFYEFTIILKFLNFLFELKVEAETYFYITTGFELLVGIFFTTFREESPKLVYKLK